MCEFKVIVAKVVCGPLPDVAEPSAQAQHLLRLANAWNRRRATGRPDALLVIGVGEYSVEQLRSQLSPFGLEAAECEVAELASIDGSFGEVVGLILQRWLQANKFGAIPLAAAPPSLAHLGYPEDLWWMGLSAGASFAGKWADSLEAVLPTPFNEQAGAWDVLLRNITDTDEESDEQALHAGLSAASLARWLAGFSTASGDQFFDFDYRSVTNDFGLDALRLGFEAARHHLDELADDFDTADDQEAEALVIQTLLKSDRYISPGSIRRFFGGASQTFFSLYSSIWPQTKRPAAEAFIALVGLESVDIEQADEAWRFVAEDCWNGIDDGL